MGSVYKLLFSSGKAYIGATTQPLIHRIRRHKKAAMTGKESFAVHQAWRDFGDPTVILLCEAEGDALHAAEMAAILEHLTLVPDGYNLTTGGRRTKFSKESKLYLSSVLKGKTFSDETRKRMSESQSRRDPKTRHYIGQIWQGKKQSPKHIAKRIRPAGWHHSDESKEKCGAVHIGEVRSDEVKAKIAESVRLARKKKNWSTKSKT